MERGEEATPVTRHEFLGALTLIWTFIMLAFSTAVFGGARSTISTPANVIYLVISFFMVTNYAVAALRGGASRKKVVVAVLLALVALIVGAVAFLAGRTSN